MASHNIRLGKLTLQPGRQLLASGAPVQIRPKPLQVLTHLANARGALITKDELLNAVWPGRVVEEGALQAHIVAVRKSLGPEADRLKTIHGVGYRLELSDAVINSEEPLGPTVQPSIAVLPFRMLGPSRKHALMAEALPHELIAELSRLRWLFVIARASSFQFRDPHPDIRRIKEVLGVKYCLSGTIEHDREKIAITVDLVDSHSFQVIWGNHYVTAYDDIHELRASVVSAITAALELQIQIHEAHRASLQSAGNLDAWSLYHLALQRVFRFTPEDNTAACALFEQAVCVDPGFARAHAGLSFTNFQHAFMRYSPNCDSEATASRRHAERAIEIDAADPFANLVLGRSLWLTGQLAESLPWIDRALVLNPNYAQAAYAHAFVDAVLCDGAQGQRQADRAMALSPIDPMHYAMMGARALSHAVRGQSQAAAKWADRAALAPNSHVLIAMIAVLGHALAGRNAQARAWADVVRCRNPLVNRDHFFRAFPFAANQVRIRFSRALQAFGF